MQNVVVFINSIEEAYDISIRDVNMYLNRLCIDEEAAFESTGVYSLKEFEQIIMWQEMRRLAENNSEDLTLHFVYAGNLWGGDSDRLLSFIRTGMEKHNIKEVMMTKLRMEKRNLIPKVNLESFCEGKKLRKKSVNEDLESLFEKIRLGKQPEFEEVRTYFLPKLTEEELELVEQKDPNYLGTFLWGIWNHNPDVDKSSMKLSESDSKFVRGFCWRTTFKVEIEKGS